MSNGYSTTRYKFHSPAYRLVQRGARSPLVQDVAERLPIIPTAIGGVAAAYAFVLVLRGLYVVALIAGVAR